MYYQELSKGIYCELRIGVIFFFYQNPSEYKKEIKKIFQKYCDLTKPQFLYQRHNKDVGLYKLRKNVKTYFDGIIDKSDFGLTEHIILTDATQEQMQTVMVEMMMNDSNPSYVLNLPNRMYFEFIPTIDYKEILNFIRFANEQFFQYYSCSGLLLGTNEHYPNRSSVNAARNIRQTRCLTDYYSVWKNSTLEDNLTKGIDGPNMIQVLSKDLYQLAGREQLLKILDDNEIYYENNEDYLLIDLANGVLPQCDEDIYEKYALMNGTLKNIILDLKKPQMYWKPEEWDKWKNRFNI